MLRARMTTLALGTAISGVWGIAFLALEAPASPAAAQARAQSDSSLPEIRVQAQRRPARVARRAPVRRAPAAAPPPQRVEAQAPETGDGGRGGERANGPVVGYVATRSATGTKTDTPILETPQSVSVVTKDQFTAQQATTISEALRYTPGVALDSYSANAFFDSVKVRGFDAPRYLDGLRLPLDPGSQFAYPRVETYGLERIEILKGPSSGLYGQSDPGGLVNMVSKRPQAAPHYEVQGQFGSHDRFQGAFDIGGPIDKNGEFLYRIVGLGQKSDTQIDYQQDNKLFIAPSFTWRPNIDTTFTILAHYRVSDNKGYQQFVPGELSLFPAPYGRVPYSRYLGEPGIDRYKLEQAGIGYAFEHRFNEFLQFRQNLRYMEVRNNLAAARVEGVLPDMRSIARTMNYVVSDSKNIALDNQLQADFATGWLKHKVLFGVDYMNIDSHSDFRTTPIAPIDAYYPVYGAVAAPPASLAPFIKVHTTQSQAGVYVQDQIKFDRWTLSLTGRQDWVKTENVSTGVYPMAGLYARNDSASTGRVGLNYLFDFGLSPYVNYSTSFVPNSGVSLTGVSFKPTTGEGKEAGIKFQPFGSNLMLTAAVFDILQKNVLTADPTNPFFNTQTDEARVRGYEFEARGNITRELEIVGGFSHLDPKVTKSVAGNTGKYLQNTPLSQASLWAKYTWYEGPLAGFGLGGGVRYVGESYGDAGNTFVIPSYVLYDASISYDFAYLRPDLKGWKAQVNAMNLTDRYYVASCGTSIVYCGLGAGRTVLGTLKYSWN
ncbi:TonB-denpendent receptor [Afipia sp. P52-10]|uniref:TonB-dependent siderophore receptor n=1 Tax=Afipia sp. P52-10 TaxID=1429916 RepID=UPI0003DF3AEE|nr:TonB-dependent siderophore receptor [Afipia sp. P52-10]ETR78576.1 TonB-denpendent receptor [Afipia sp. P52-10]